MAIVFEPAIRKKAKARILLAGPSGSGKTYSALQLAKGLGGKVVVIDTEAGSANLYANLGNYAVGQIAPPYTAEKYMEALKAAEKQFDVVIFDTISALWSGDGGLLDQQQKITDAMASKNPYTAWKTITPKWSGFLEAILASPAHVICTSRSKQDYQQVEDNGKKKVVKLGMAPQLRDSTEYEFTIAFDITHEKHLAVTSKDRTMLFGADAPFVISEATGKTILDWLESGEDVTFGNIDGVPAPKLPPNSPDPAPYKAPDEIVDSSATDHSQNKVPVSSRGITSGPGTPDFENSAAAVRNVLDNIKPAPKEAKINWGKLHVTRREASKAINREVSEEDIRNFSRKYFQKESGKDWTLEEFDLVMKWLRAMQASGQWVE